MMPFYSLRRKTPPPDAGQGEVCRGFALRGANCEFSTSSRLLGGCVYYLSPCVIYVITSHDASSCVMLMLQLRSTERNFRP